MFLKCANPDCSAGFDYRQGRIYIFRNHASEEGAHQNAHAVRHYWLCEQCVAVFTLEDRKRDGVLIHPRYDAPKECLSGAAPAMVPPVRVEIVRPTAEVAAPPRPAVRARSVPNATRTRTRRAARERFPLASASTVALV